MNAYTAIMPATNDVDSARGGWAQLLRSANAFLPGRQWTAVRAALAKHRISDSTPSSESAARGCVSNSEFCYEPNERNKCNNHYFLSVSLSINTYIHMHIYIYIYIYIYICTYFYTYIYMHIMIMLVLMLILTRLVIVIIIYKSSRWGPLRQRGALRIGFAGSRVFLEIWYM